MRLNIMMPVWFAVLPTLLLFTIISTGGFSTVSEVPLWIKQTLTQRQAIQQFTKVRSFLMLYVQEKC
jgi:hypothetical protein